MHADLNSQTVSKVTDIMDGQKQGSHTVIYAKFQQAKNTEKCNRPPRVPPNKNK